MHLSLLVNHNQAPSPIFVYKNFIKVMSVVPSPLSSYLRLADMSDHSFYGFHKLMLLSSFHMHPCNSQWIPYCRTQCTNWLSQSTHLHIWIYWAIICLLHWLGGNHAWRHTYRPWPHPLSNLLYMLGVVLPAFFALLILFTYCMSALPKL